jgi:hypothetical protein
MEQRLEKAVLNFQLLIHDYHLAILPAAPGVRKRFCNDRTRALTFADDSRWLRSLNSALILIQLS